MSSEQASSFLSSLVPAKEEGFRFDYKNRLDFKDPQREFGSYLIDAEDEKVVPLHERPRKLNFWDQKPKNYEHLTAEQAKATGIL